MKSKWLILVVLVCAAEIPSLFAQTAEINPYAGFYWRRSTSEFGSFENNQLLGVRGGYLLPKGFELGGGTIAGAIIFNRTVPLLGLVWPAPLASRRAKSEPISGNSSS